MRYIYNILIVFFVCCEYFSGVRAEYARSVVRDLTNVHLNQVKEKGGLKINKSDIRRTKNLNRLMEKFNSENPNQHAEVRRFKKKVLKPEVNANLTSLNLAAGILDNRKMKSVDHLNSFLNSWESLNPKSREKESFGKLAAFSNKFKQYEKGKKSQQNNVYTSFGEFDKSYNVVDPVDEFTLNLDKLGVINEDFKRCLNRDFQDKYYDKGFLETAFKALESAKVMKLKRKFMNVCGLGSNDRSQKPSEYTALKDPKSTYQSLTSVDYDYPAPFSPPNSVPVTDHSEENPYYKTSSDQDIPLLLDN